jgi:hypothetical protein
MYSLSPPLLGVVFTSRYIYQPKETFIIIEHGANLTFGVFDPSAGSLARKKRRKARSAVKLDLQQDLELSKAVSDRFIPRQAVG